MPQVQYSAALASAPARGFATGAPAPAAKGNSAPAAKSDFNWDELEESAASDNGKRELQLLRSTFMDVQQKIGDMTKVPRDAGRCMDPLGLPPRGCVQSIRVAALRGHDMSTRVCRAGAGCHKLEAVERGGCRPAAGRFIPEGIRQCAPCRHLYADGHPDVQPIPPFTSCGDDHNDAMSTSVRKHDSICCQALVGSAIWLPTCAILSTCCRHAPPEVRGHRARRAEPDLRRPAETGRNQVLCTTNCNRPHPALQLPAQSEPSAHGQLATCSSTKRARQPATHEVTQTLQLYHAFPSPFFRPLQAGELASHSETRMKEIQQEISAIDQELVRLCFRV
jgi:hypothetical protein